MINLKCEPENWKEKNSTLSIRFVRLFVVHWFVYSGGKPQEIRKSSVIRQRTRLRVGREPQLLQVNVRYDGRVRLQDIGGYQQEVCYHLFLKLHMYLRGKS